MKTNWNKTLAEVLKHQTEEILLRSEHTGNEYIAESVLKLSVLSTGSIEEINSKYKYSIVDVENDLEYTIKTPNRVEVKFGTPLLFTNVRGGATNNGIGWFAADKVEVQDQKEVKHD